MPPVATRTACGLDHLGRPVRLRARTASDETLHRAVFASTRELEVALLGPDFLDQQLRARDAGYAGAEHDVVLVGDHDAGYLVTSRTPGAFVIVDVALLPEFRGQGVGTALVAWACAEAAAAGVPARLSVLAHNPARRLYERSGFTATGEAGLTLTMEWTGPCSTA